MLEGIVRPFSQPNTPSAIIASNATSTIQRAVITWNATGNLPGPQPTEIKLECCHEDDQEIDRKTDDVRIENPDDPTQYVIVRRANELSLDKTEDKTKCDNWGMVSIAQPGDVTALLDFGFGDTLFPKGKNKCRIVMKLNNNTTSPQALPSSA